METRAILLISSALFSCGFVGLLTVRLTNPFFKGLGWLGGAFAAGALGAILFTVHPGISSGVSVLVPDTLILLAYVFLHVCFLELTGSESLMPRLGIVLLVIQAASYPVLGQFHDPERYGIILLGLVLTAQATQSVLLLRRSFREEIHAPVWFTGLLLTIFAGYNLLRSAVVFFLGTPQNPAYPNPLELTTAFVFLGTGMGLGFGVFWMMSDQVRIALEGLANTDPLTGICNRRIFIQLCEKELMRSSRSGESFSLIMFDIDHFKPINDRYGHGMGDLVLCAVVEKLRNAVRNIDTVGRWGGEEFVALLPNADAHAAMIVAQRLQRSVESLAVPNTQRKSAEDERTIHVTISIGVTTYIGQNEKVEDLLHRCDAAMYQAKAEGRNRIVATSPQYALFA